MTHSPFESIKHTLDGVEVWYARELYPILGYTNWNKFQDLIQKAKVAIQTSGANPEEHFYPEVKLIEAGKWAKRSIDGGGVVGVGEWGEEKREMWFFAPIRIFSN